MMSILDLLRRKRTNLDFYYNAESAPCRAVMMTAQAVGVDLNPKSLNLMAGDHLKPEYLKINPQHTIPTVVDKGYIIFESCAIMIYLAEKYGKKDSLYPKCPKKRALVNQRLFFDMGTLYQRLADYYYPQIFDKTPADPMKYQKIEDAFSFFNIFLEGQQYAAGENLTLADIALVATVSTYEAANFDINKYPNVAKWYKHCKIVTPGIGMNISGVRRFKKFFN